MKRLPRKHEAEALHREAQAATPQPTQKGHLLVSFALCCTALIDADYKLCFRISFYNFNFSQKGITMTLNKKTT